MDHNRMMGVVSESDRRYSVSVRDWDAMKRALWRSKVAWDIAQREAEALVKRAAHMEGCAGKDDETASCLADCPDRELRLSALVILNAARQLTQAGVSRPADAPFFAPSRELYSEILGELAACHAELEALRGAKVTEPPAVEPEKSPKQLKEAT